MPRPRRYAEIGLGLAVRLERTRRGGEACELDQRRHRSTTVFRDPTEDSLFVLESKGTDATHVVDSKQEVELIEGPRVDRFSSALRFIPALRVVAVDDAPAPTISFGVGDGRVKDRTVARLLVELGARNELERRVDGEPILRSQPAWVVLERSVLSRALRVVVDQAEEPRSVAQEDPDRPLHSEVGSRFGWDAFRNALRVEQKALFIMASVDQVTKGVAEPEHEQRHRVHAHGDGRVSLLDADVRALGYTQAFRHHRGG